MPLEARLLTGLAIAVAVVYWTTPLAIRVADRFEFYDKPRGYKGHARPTPYLGGSALIAGFLVALMLLASDWERTTPVVGGVILLWAVGTIDDRHDVPWWIRVLVELGLAALLWGTGLGWDTGFGGGVDLLLTAFWLVAVVNAFNLFDNMDGQSATMGLVTSMGLTALGIAIGNTWVAVAGAAMAGACFGFLPHNLLSQPARIFLGDGGSMPLGFAIAAVAMIGAVDAAGEWQAVALGLLLVGIPALDTTLVVVSRRRRGLSVLTPGRDHLTHRARQRLRTAFAVAVALGSAQVVVSLMAVAASRGSTLVLSLTAGLYIVALGVAVAVIDTRIPAVPPTAPAPAADAVVPARPTRLAWLPREAPLLIVLGVGAAVSPWFEGYYGTSVWGPMALVLLVCLLAVGIARPPHLSRRGWTALGGLAALGLWGLLSALWADSIEQATVDANRTLTLAAALALALLLIRDRRSALWALGSFGAGAAAVELTEVFRLLGPEAAQQFLGGRLDQPLGYINAQATFSILALWPMIALAEQRRSALAAGAGLAMATLLTCMVMLSQSRGAALAIIGSAVLVLLVVPGRRRRGLALGVLAVAVAVASSSVMAIYREGVTDGRVHSGVLAALGAAAVAGLVWAAIVALEQHAGDAQRRQLRRAVTVGFVALAVLALGAAAVSTSRISDEVSAQYDAFVHLGAAQGGEQTASRLLTGAGNRYDYWAIAANAWRDNPVLGVGAGNYDQPYFLRRSTAEDIRQPHSMALQALAELGIPGLLLLLTFFGAVALGAWRHAAIAARDRGERALLVAGVGVFGAWLVHTQVDWIHLLPGITLAALLAAAVLLRPLPDGRRVRAWIPPTGGRARKALLAAVVMVPVAVAGVSLSRQVLAQHYRGEAQEAVAEQRAEAAIREANRGLKLDAEDMRLYYAKAAAFAQLGEAGLAKDTLQEASRREPGDFLPYALLGDLSVRLRQFDAAESYYGQALARNPREPTLIELAKDPRAAIR